MSSAEADSGEMQYTSLLEACEAALESGDPASVSKGEDVPPELRRDLERDLAYVELLREVLPNCPSTVSFDRATRDAAGDARPPGELPWTRLGRFEMRRELGRGTFGIVYLAYDPHLGREVAIKIPRIDVLADPDQRQRFQREARAAAGLDHATIVPVYEAGEVGPVCFIASAYYPGVTLAKWLKQGNGPVPFRTAATLIAALADGVAHAHHHGVIHRDLKPANVLLVLNPKSEIRNPKQTPSTNEPNPKLQAGDVSSIGHWDFGFVSDFELRISDFSPKITDFGLAKMLAVEGSASAPGQTQSGAIVGTPSYMAPEQAGGRSKEIGPAADIYALGVILYELLTGRPPFQAESTLDTLLLVRTEEPVRPARLRPRVPRDLETICLKAMAKAPARRYPSARALAEDLGHWLKGEPIRARPVNLWERGVYWAKRRPAIAALLATVVLVTITGFSAVTWQWRQTEAALEKEENTLYFHRIALSERELSAGNPGRAEELLQECPERRRGWEWHYLLRRRFENLPPLNHASLVQSVKFSPDGRWLASGDRDGIVKIWDALTGRELRSFKGTGDQIRTLNFSPNGRCLVAAGGQGKSSGELNVWDLTSGKELLTLHAGTQFAPSAAFTPDGRYFATGTGDGPVKVYDATTWKETYSLGGHASHVTTYGLAFSPDGRFLASTSGDGTVRVWDATTWKELDTLLDAGGTNKVVFSPNGQRLATVSRDKTVKLWDTTTWKEIHTIRGLPEYVWAAAFSPDSRRLALGTFDGTLKICDGQTGEEMITFLGHPGPVFALAFTPDGRRMMSAGFDKKIRIWETATWQEALTLHGHTADIRSLTFSADGCRLASASFDHTVRIWNATPWPREQKDPQALTIHGHAHLIIHVAFSPDSRRVASASWDQSVKVWEVSSGQELLTLRGHTGLVWAVAFSPDGRYLASGSLDGTLKVWDALTGKEVRTVPGQARFIYALAYSPDGKYLVSGHIQQCAKVWDATTGELRRTLTGHADPVMCLAFSRDGRHLASVGSLDQTVKIWDGNTWQPIRMLEGRSILWSAGFTPDGRRLAAAGYDGMVRVWDITTGELVKSFPAHGDRIYSVAFSPDGRYLVSGSADSTAKVWDAETWQEIRTLTGHAGDVWSVAFSPDGQRLASASGYKGKGEIKIWNTTLWKSSQ